MIFSNTLMEKKLLEKIEELENALERTIRHKGTAIIDVQIEAG